MSSHDGQASEKTIVTNLESKTLLKSIGPYDIIKPVGHGGMGEVFLCRDSRNPDAPPVAVKTVFPELLEEPAIVKRFEAEARALASIRHPGVVQFYECGTFETAGRTSYYMAMEYIDGVSLYTLSRQRRLSFPDILMISIQIARGLEATHNGSVIHRDLKPGNIMITKEGLAKIIDFGIAKPSLMGMENNEDPARGFKTQTGIFIGTVNYVAPEILRDKPASVSSDIYALGLIIWEMLNSKAPFKADNLALTIKNVTTDTLVWPTLIGSLAPIGFIDFIDTVLLKDPSLRPKDAGSVAAALEKIAAAARWTGALGRKTRFDLNIFWSSETISQITKLDISEPEIAYVLQEIEDQLTAMQDARLLTTTPIVVSSELIAKCVGAYRRTRFEISKRRMTRPQDMVNTGPIPFKLVTAESTIPTSFTSPSSFRAIMTAIVIAGSATYFGFTQHPDKMPNSSSIARLIRRVTLSQEVARDLAGGPAAPAAAPQAAAPPVATKSIATPVASKPVENKSVVLGDTVKPLPVMQLATGRMLSYRVTKPAADGTISVGQHTRLLTAMSESELIWLVDGKDTVRTPRSFLGVEAYFHPIYRTRADVPTERFSESRIFPLTAGVVSYIELTDPQVRSKEKIECIPVSSRYSTILSEQHEVWKIECVREVTYLQQITHKVIETYQYSPSLGAILEGDIRTTMFDPNGATISTVTSQFDLQLQLSVF